MTKRDNHTEDLVFREARIEPGNVRDDRTFEISFSSETPVLLTDFFGNRRLQVLGHDPEEIDLERYNAGAPVLHNHRRTRDDHVGVVRKAWVKNRRGYAEVQLSRRDDVTGLFTDVQDGVLINASVGFRVLEEVLVKQGDDGPDEYRVTRWEPMELSLVDIPADPYVGVGRSVDRGPSAAQTTGADPMKDQKAVRDQLRREEQERRSSIRDVFGFAPDTAACADLQSRCLEDMDCSVDQARQLLLEEMGRNKSPSGRPHLDQTALSLDRRGSLSLAQTSRISGFSNEFSDALLYRRGILPADKVSDSAKALAHLSLREGVRTALEMTGSYSTGMSVSQEFARIQSSDDTKQLLANVMSKSLIAGFDNPEISNHKAWTTKVDANDFKPLKAVALSEAPELLLVAEGGELPYGFVQDTGVDTQLRTYKRAIKFTREAYINDDLQALTTLPMGLGKAAVRLEKNLIYAALVLNPTMGDGTDLFHADHGNLGTPAAPSVASLGEAKQLMRTQRNLQDEAFLDVTPRFLIVPAALETAAEQLLNSIFDPDGTTSSAHNPFARKLELIVEPRLDASSQTGWYLVCHPDTFHWFSRAYLRGQESPIVEERAEWDTDALEFKCIFDFDASPIRWEGAVFNAGQ